MVENIQSLECMVQDQPMRDVKQQSNFHCHWAQDDLMLSSLLTLIIRKSIHWLFDPAADRPQDDSTYVEHSWRLSQGIDCWRCAYCGGPTSSLQVGSRYHTQLSLCLLNVHTQPPAPVYHLCATLEISLPGSAPCPAQVSLCLGRQNLENKHADLGFATASPSWVFPSWALFDMVLCFLFERKWLQENIETFMMLNRRRRWFHSSRVKWLLVNMSASWFLVSTHLVWTLILSNNQSSATLWVLDTCLIVGLLPLMIILIAASLSSKKYNGDSPWEECAFVTTWSTSDSLSTSRFPLELRDKFSLCWLVGDFVLFEDRKTSITSSIGQERGSVHSQSSIQRNDFGFWILTFASWEFRKYIRFTSSLI